MNKNSIVLKESELKIIIEKAIKNKLNENNNSELYVYHCARTKDIKSIFKYGAERCYFGTNAGNFYGPGVYTTVDLASSVVNAHRSEYGRNIIRFKVLNDYNKFIIWEEPLARMVYGDYWRVKDQFSLLFPNKVIQHMKRISYGDGSLYSYLARNVNFGSKLAKRFYEECNNNNYGGINPYNLVDGFVFRGNRDGYVAIFKNAKSISPYQYTTNFGKTWITAETETTLEYTKNSFDSEYLYGHLYDKVFTTERGWAKVMKGGKVNYIDKDGSEISDVWLDGGGHFGVVDGESMAEIVYEGESFYIDTDGNVFQSIVDEYPICELEELPDLFQH